MAETVRTLCGIMGPESESNQYLPAATKLGQGNVFTGVCDSVRRGGVSALVHAGIPPPSGSDPPEANTPLPGADTPPPELDPPWDQTHPGADTPREADSGIRSTSGRYASTGMHSRSMCISMMIKNAQLPRWMLRVSRCCTEGKSEAYHVCR